MSYFSRIIKRCRKNILAEGQSAGSLTLLENRVEKVETYGLDADQRRVKQSVAEKPRKIVDRTGDLSIERYGEISPVLEREQEDKSNERSSNNYVGNSSVSSGINAEISTQSGAEHTEVSKCDSLRSRKLGRFGSLEKSVMQFSDSQSDKAHKAESESERVELEAGEETYSPMGNRSGPVADIFLNEKSTNDEERRVEHFKPTDIARSLEEHVSPDELLFNSSPAKFVVEEDSDEQRELDEQKELNTQRLMHDVLESEQQQEDRVSSSSNEGNVAHQMLYDLMQPIAVPEEKRPSSRVLNDRINHASDEQHRSNEVRIGRVSVTISSPKKEAHVERYSVPRFAVESLSSRYFMGDV